MSPPILAMPREPSAEADGREGVYILDTDVVTFQSDVFCLRPRMVRNASLLTRPVSSNRLNAIIVSRDGSFTRSSYSPNKCGIIFWDDTGFYEPTTPL